MALIGRERELSRLLEVLGGDTRMLLVSGDAGVGKTRFAAEGMVRAGAAGMVLLRGECLALASTLPLLPIAAALRDLGSLEGGALLEAALAAAPQYAQEEVARLLPHLGHGGGAGSSHGDGAWRRERLFSAVADLLSAVARRAPVGLVIEDVHWADSATLDCLTFLTQARSEPTVTVVVTCRSDEAPLAPHVRDWLAHMRGATEMEEVRLGPLSRREVAEQVAGLTDGPVQPQVLEVLYARAQGNAFFTEQLVAAALADPAGGVLGIPAGLPARLAELLTARAGRCAGDAQTVLAALAVASRPLTEDLLASVTLLDVEVVRQGLRELAAARLLGEDNPGVAHRPRHALLAEAVAGGLLPGERSALHERAARALRADGDQAVAAEVAGHWQAAGNPAEELPARVAAAKAAECVFGYAEAAAQWGRAIELCQQLPSVTGAAGIDVPRLYVRAIDALEVSGDSMRAGAVAEEAYRRFADHPDAATAAVIHHRAGIFRGIDEPAAGRALIEEAIRLHEQAPPSADHADAWFRYATIYLFHADGRSGDSFAALNRALEIAEAAAATDLIPSILSHLAIPTFQRGKVDEGFALLRRARALAREVPGDGEGGELVAVTESNALLKTGQFRNAAEVAVRDLRVLSSTGRQAGFGATVLAANAAEAMLACGRTSEAAALIDPLTPGAPDRDHYLVHEFRAEIDLLRGNIDAAASRLQQVNTLTSGMSGIEQAREIATRTAEVALWAGRPGDVIHNVNRVLAMFKNPDLAIFCGRLLTLGLRACADLTEQARARREVPPAHAAGSAAASLAAWTDHMGSAPFTDHPFVATIPADRATWDAERTRLAGTSDPAAWETAAQIWQDLACPHRAGYAWWRQAQAHLNAGQPTSAAAAALRAAESAAEGHAPLLAQIRILAERARIPLQAPVATTRRGPSAEMALPYKLTSRELTVLCLLAGGRTNAQIGAELYISPKTASVHVTSILRKLGVSNRVQAAALAERAGLLRPVP